MTTTSPAKPWSLLAHVGFKCPACGSGDILAECESSTYSMVFAEAKKNAGVNVEVDGRIHIGKFRSEMRSIIDSLSDETVGALRDANRPGMGFYEFKGRWLDELLVNLAVDGMRYYCGNPSCSAKLAARVEHLASRGCLDLVGLGAEACTAIAETGITHPFDVLVKPVEWFAGLSWKTESGGNMTFGMSRAEKVVRAIQAAPNLPLNRWIAACGIPSVGENTSKEISRIFQYPVDLVRQYADAEGVHDVLKQVASGADKTKGWLAAYKVSHHLGPVSAQAMLDFIGSPDGAYALAMMSGRAVQSHNWDPIPAEPQPSPDKPFVGKSFCVTGTLSVPRELIHDLIRAAGGTIVSGVSKKTHVLVAGDKAGSKLKKAADLGVEVWTETELRKLAKYEG